MAKCLRCGADSSWIQGRVLDEPQSEVARPSDEEINLELEELGNAMFDCGTRAELPPDGAFRQRSRDAEQSRMRLRAMIRGQQP